MAGSKFVHLHVHSPFSFLDGADGIDTLVERAAALDMPALALTDHDNVSGAVRFTQACLAAGLKPILGAELTTAPMPLDAKTAATRLAEPDPFPESVSEPPSGADPEGDGPVFHLTALAMSPAGYGNLCRLLTASHMHRPRGRPRARWRDLVRYKDDIVFLSGCVKGQIPSLLRQRRHNEARRLARLFADVFGRDNFFFELGATELPGQRALNETLVALARDLHIQTVAAGNVHYARPERHPVHDVLRCIAAGVTVEQPRGERPFNDQLYMLSPRTMARRFAWHPEAVANAARLAARVAPGLVLGRRRHPRFHLPIDGFPGGSDTETPAAALLRRLAYDGALRRYGRVEEGLRRRIEEELSVIDRLDMADYFLIAWDAVRFAKERGIRTSGRGSAADSVVAYCLALTDVDAYARGLGFERFLSVERGEPPDIDIDIEAERREEVADYVYRRYGRDRVAAVAAYHTYRARGALREVGKVLGISKKEIDDVAQRMPSVPADGMERALDHYPELRAAARRLRGDRLRRRWLELAASLAGLPRHLGVHSSGLVIGARPLTETMPLQRAAKGVVMSPFDKDDVEALGYMKLDLLFLRILGAVNTTAAAIRRRDGQFDYDRIPDGDVATYARLRRGETVGVFQLESPAQRALHPRLRPDNFEDIVASVALIRPGPVKGDMVQPFIARRNRKEPVAYAHPDLEPILKKTYGIVLFQEQIIDIARVIAGFTPGEADKLRRAMSSFRSQKDMDRIGERFVAKAVANGYDPETARTIFGYISGFAGYGFNEAHAASFANTAYKTAYLLEHHPAEFFAALLSHQPMGFYPPNTLLWKARRRGVPVRGLCVNRSRRRWIVEEDGALRVPWTQVRDLSGTTGAALQAVRKERPFASLADFVARVPEASAAETERLILGGAFDGLHPNRKGLLWQLPRLRRRARVAREAQRRWDVEGADGDGRAEGEDFTPWERDVREYSVLGLTTRRHLLHHWRPKLNRRGALSCAAAAASPHGRPVAVGGLVIRPHRPPTKSGRTVVFLTLEDETGLVDVTVFEDVYMRYGEDLFVKPLLLVRGTVERRDGAVSVTARRLLPFAP